MEGIFCPSLKLTVDNRAPVGTNKIRFHTFFFNCSILVRVHKLDKIILSKVPGILSLKI